MRLTHRRCRHETDGLADAARYQTQRAEDLADDLRATQHGLDEVADACTSTEYAQSEADIPQVLRTRLDQAGQLPGVTAERDAARARVAALTAQREALLQAAHAAGTLARTGAVLDSDGLDATVSATGAGALLASVTVITWVGFGDWPCRDAACDSDVRTLVWHTTTPGQAHLACECGRIWQAPPGAVDRAERQHAECDLFGGGHRTTPLRWSQLAAPVLEAIDRALPAPATADRQQAAAA